jgi:hypothetical protein
MDTGDPRGTALERAPEIVLQRDGSDPVGEPPMIVRTPGPAETGTSLLRIAVLLGVGAGLVVALVVGALLVLRGGESDVRTSTPDPPAAQAPAGPAELTVHVETPTGVVAGEKSVFVVHYDDGEGVFSGSTEEWGDGVGTSSLAQQPCGPSAVTSKAATGSFRTAHTWAEPGSYQVALGVTTYTCVDGSPVTEDASTTVTVEVAPR